MRDSHATHELCPASGRSAGIACRRLLAAATAAPVIAATAAVAAAEHDDAELLAAWRGYQQAYRDFNAACDLLPNGGTEKDHAPFCRRIDAHQDKIEELPARSMAGVAVKLRLLFACQVMSIDAHAAAIYGAPVSSELVAEMDADDNLLWRLIGDVERVAGGAVA